MGATSGPGSQVSIVKAGALFSTGRHRPAMQNQSSFTLVNRHLSFGERFPVNS
jgi:hypothetical protein